MAGYDILIKSPHKGPSVAADGQTATRRLAEYAAETRWKNLPLDVIEHARRILLDTLGTILGGSIEPEPTVMANRLGRPDGNPSTVIGHRLRASSLNAALVNGTAACWMDFDSGHRPPPGKPLLPAAHPPIHLIPSALAVAEATAASGQELLTALVVGYDAGARIGMASRVRAEIHCHGTHHNVAAAVAAARLMRYSIEQTESTIGLAAHLSLMPSFENAYQGGTVRNTYAGVGAATGILAAQLASIGFTPEKDALGSVYGGVISPWFDPDRLVDSLGKRFEITQGFIKRYPMCRFGHPAIEATEKLLAQYPLESNDIESVEVYTFDWAATLTEREPKTDLAAKFSVPWAVACMLVRRSAGPDEFRPHALEDTKLREMALKISVKEDPQYSAMTPLKRPARITVKTKAGKIYEAEVEQSSGGPDAPLPKEKVIEKFRSLADPILGPGQAEAVVEKVMHLEDEPDIRRLTELLIPVKPFRHEAAKSCAHTSGGKSAVGDYLDRLVELATSISLDKLPPSVVHEGRRTLVDTVGVILGGMRESEPQALAHRMAETSVAAGSTGSTILGSGRTADPMWTALAHGAAGSWHEFDAGNRFSGGHPALYSISAGLPVAEREGASGKRLLESVIGGYEVGARIGLGTTLRPGMDPHGSWPIVAAAATASLLTGTDLRKTINLVTSLNLATSWRAAWEGATIRNIYAGFGSAMGVLATDLCRDGFSAERDGISTVFGTIAGVFFDVEKTLEKIGDRWEIGRGYFKPYACSRNIHPALDGLIALVKEQDLTPGEIAGIEVSTYAMAALNGVATGASAPGFSMPYALASYLVLKEAGPPAYRQEALRSPAIEKLAAKVTVKEDPEMNRRTPVERPAKVTLHLNNGKSVERLVKLPRGESDSDPLSDAELSEKFLKLTSSLLGMDRSEKLLDKLWHIEAVNDLREVTTLGKIETGSK